MKGALTPGQLADLAVLSADYFSVADEDIKRIESVLTLVGGRPVHGSAEFSALAPPAPPASPGWAPDAKFDGYWRDASPAPPGGPTAPARMVEPRGRLAAWRPRPWDLGCECFAF